MGTVSAKVTPGHPEQPALQARARRAPLVHAAMCRFADAADFTELTTLNISQSGMLVRCPSPPATGTTMDFKFLLETGFEILSGSGKVMRLTHDAELGALVGIAFDELEPPKRRILARVIELHSEPQADETP
jgi:hypothetical protein